MTYQKKNFIHKDGFVNSLLLYFFLESNIMLLHNIEFMMSINIYQTNKLAFVVSTSICLWELVEMNVCGRLLLVVRTCLNE